MIDENKYNQYGIKRKKEDILGITIHNTNNYNASIHDIFDWLNNGIASSGCHYLVDDKEVLEVMPLDYAVYHTGKALDYGNKHTIAIEISSNLNEELYLKGQSRAISLIKDLMNKYNLGIDAIYFHKDFNENTYCPATILDLYKNKKTFIKKFFRKEEQ